MGRHLRTLHHISFLNTSMALVAQISENINKNVVAVS